MSNAMGQDGSLAARINDAVLLAMMVVIAAILTTAMVLQYAFGELPCPLCLLQRAAMFGVCFGIILHFRYGASARHTGVSLLFALLLLIVSVRQTLLDIYPRPGHSYIGTAVFGLHMPVWSVLIALAILLAFAVKLTLLGSQPQTKPATGALGGLAKLVSLYVIALCAINFVSVIMQCGLGECHTFGYKLLGG
jgi:disulfide bond formation protein DsbB